MTSHQIESSAILNHARLALTGAQTHGARYAHKRYFFSKNLVFQNHIFSNTCGLTLSQSLSGRITMVLAHWRGSHSGFSTFTLNLLHFLLPLWCLQLSTFPQDFWKKNFFLCVCAVRFSHAICQNINITKILQ